MKKSFKLDLCEEYYNEFKNNFTVPDIFEDTRRRPIVEYRQLFQTILRNEYKFSYQLIADYFTSKGKKLDHASIIHAVKKTVNTNYYACDYIADIYDVYFEDKKDERLAKKRLKQLKLANIKSHKLYDLVRDIPKEREDEVYEMLLLRVKSWKWKSKDKCEIVESNMELI